MAAFAEFPSSANWIDATFKGQVSMYLDNQAETTEIVIPSFLDSPEVKRGIEVRRREFALKTATIRMRDFLQSCSQQGHRYHAGDSYPTIKRLAEYCNCEPSTIQRIKDGDRQSVRLDILDTLSALAGVAPDVDFDELAAERKRRLVDADRWLEDPSPDKGDVVQALINGIRLRSMDRRLGSRTDCHRL